MKVLILVAIFFLSSATHANQEHSYDWQSTTYQTFLGELDTKAELVALTEYSSKYENAVVVCLNLLVGSVKLEFPQDILREYEPIHPDSFRISAGDFSQGGSLKKWVTVHFRYGMYPNIHDGSISFLNNKYEVRSIYIE